jgi:acetolactate synthase-1/2/3 large subunit
MNSPGIKVAADAVIQFLANQGIAALHNYPGGTIAPLLDACHRFGIKVYTSRHEQGAGYAALAQAKLTGLPGIVAVTSGPGVTNVLTPVADAFFDGVPDKSVQVT